ncbi:hypothetical protein TCELL_1041 [Thermogladius calderae 1633]|uniref:Uncharacterized protein n=1 Tax=Thermogladius calderae (strain DSM 22663 / VKM B-2946 / 1633) TaxID=1184251 RepID=I3TFC6_THEC1|nr:hypothetical protein TCELL_1041 [Thermogladius calderae 1633]
MYFQFFLIASFCRHASSVAYSLKLSILLDCFTEEQKKVLDALNELIPFNSS